MENKTCHTCKESLPLSDFQVDRQQPSGYRGQCKKCKAKRRKELKNGAERKKVNGVRKPRAKRIPVKMEKKTCTKCRIKKDISEFYELIVAEHIQNGVKIEAYISHQRRCKDCQREDQKKYTNPKPVREHTQGVKNCFGCKQDKPYSDFNRNAAAKDKYQSRCRTCEAEKFKNKRMLEINYAHFYYPVNDF